MDQYNIFLKKVLANAQLSGKAKLPNAPLPTEYKGKKLKLLPMIGSLTETKELESIIESLHNFQSVPIITEDLSFLDKDPLYDYFQNQKLNYTTAILQFEPLIVDFYKQNINTKFEESLIDAIVTSLISTLPGIGYDRFLFLTNIEPEDAERKTNEVKKILESQGDLLNTSSEEIVTELLLIANSFTKQLFDRYLLKFENTDTIIAYLSLSHIPLFLLETIPTPYVLSEQEVDAVKDYHQNIISALRAYAKSKKEYLEEHPIESKNNDIVANEKEKNKKDSNFQMIIGNADQTFEDLKTQVQTPKNKIEKLDEINAQIDAVNEKRKFITETYYQQLKQLDREEESLFLQRRKEMNETG